MKICGITRVEDALAAVSAGAHAVGFIMWPSSPRFIDPYRVQRIVAALPAFVTTVGVFVNQSQAEVNGAAAIAGVSAVQLHGDETPDFAAGMRRPVIKALTLDDDGADAWPSNVVLLVDAYDPVRRGGTGEKADWSAAAALARKRCVVLAGGLHAGNVAEAVATVRPFGLDVSSGVESAPGIKDHMKINALFEAVHRS